MKTKMHLPCVLVMFAYGSVGCGDGYSPSAPSVVPRIEQPTAVHSPIQPVVTTMKPSVGSTGGGGWGTITGENFQLGAIVRVGGVGIWARVQDSHTIAFAAMPAHAPDTVEVVVINPGGLESRLTGGYTYAARESFDFNGDWVAHAGPEFETDMRFTIRNNRLVSLSCGPSDDLILPASASSANGEFSVVGDGDFAVAGVLVSPVNAVGTINVPGCAGARWWADKRS